MKRPLPLAAYRLAASAVSPRLPLFLRWRQRRGKEDAARLGERMGIASAPRPPGPLAWLHGASIGEAISLMPLAAELRARGFHVLMTSGTATSAALVAKRLPAGAVHQYLPLDAPRFVSRFFAHWRPEIGIIAETELWPNLIEAAHAGGTRLALVNARMSDRSFRRWGKARSSAEFLLSKFRLCLTQTAEDESRFRALGANAETAGNLKYDSAAPEADPEELARLRQAFAGRRIWLAASTHAGEEEQMLAAHRRLLNDAPAARLNLAPRHPGRGAVVAALARAENFAAVLRSAGEAPGAETQVYVADTIGELGLFYRLAPVSFIGRSFARQGGQNPIEPAKLGSAVLHGPHVGNFEAVYATFARQGGALEVIDAESLARAVQSLWDDEPSREALCAGAARAVAVLGGATERVLAALQPLLAEALAARSAPR